MEGGVESRHAVRIAEWRLNRRPVVKVVELAERHHREVHGVSQAGVAPGPSSLPHSLG